MAFESWNKFLVASHGDRLVVMNPLPLSFTPDDALLLAAWLVAMAQPFATEPFADVLSAVKSS